jgi:hypothetical protein
VNVPTGDLHFQRYRLNIVSQMISDKVTVTQSEKTLSAPDAAAASQLAGFHNSCFSRQ